MLMTALPAGRRSTFRRSSGRMAGRASRRCRAIRFEVTAGGWGRGQAVDVDHLERIGTEVGEKERVAVGGKGHFAGEGSGGDGAERGVGSRFHFRGIENRSEERRVGKECRSR